MRTDRAVWLALAVLPLLAGCEQGITGGREPASTFGEANRQTMLAQTVDPEPEYEGPLTNTSAEHAAQAVARYGDGAVKQPDRVDTTQVGSSGGGSN